MAPLVRTGGSRHTGLAAPPHRNIQQRNRSKVAEEMDYEAAGGDSVISEQDEVDTQPKTNGLPEDGAEIAENVISDADVIVKETNE